MLTACIINTKLASFEIGCAIKVITLSNSQHKTSRFYLVISKTSLCLPFEPEREKRGILLARLMNILSRLYLWEKERILSARSLASQIIHFPFTFTNSHIITLRYISCRIWFEWTNQSSKVILSASTCSDECRFKSLNNDNYIVKHTSCVSQRILQ